MKVYFAAPIVNHRDRNHMDEIYKMIESLGHTIISEWIIWNNPNPGLNVNDIYERDSRAIEACDILIAEVSKPSIGAGMEIMFAHQLGKKIICIHNGCIISNFLLGMPDIRIIDYTDSDDLFIKLKDAIFL